MTTFTFNEQVNAPLPDVTPAALGATTGGAWTNADLGKPVKMGTANNYVLCADGDPIEGVLVAIEPFTVNDGFPFGTVQKNKRFQAVLDTGETGVTVGAIVVAGANAAVGTANTVANKPVVAVEPTPGDAGDFKWRVIRLIDGGEAGDLVLIEKI